MRLDDRLRDPQAEAGALDRPIAGAVAAEEALEQVRMILLRDAPTRIGHLHHRNAVRGRDTDLHSTSGRSELERVREKIFDHLAEPSPVDLDRFQLFDLEAEVDIAIESDRTGRLDRVRNERSEVALLRPKGQAAGLDLRDVEKVTDEVHEAGCIPVDDPQRLALFPGELSGFALKDELEVSADRRERRPELVETEATNSPFRRSSSRSRSFWTSTWAWAISASARAACSAASSRSRSVSISFRSVMSCAVPTTAIGVPPSSSTTIPRA